MSCQNTKVLLRGLPIVALLATMSVATPAMAAPDVITLELIGAVRMAQPSGVAQPHGNDRQAHDQARDELPHRDEAHAR